MNGPFVYDSPMVLESFDALDVMGATEGREALVAGNGSQLPTITIAG